MKQRNKTGFTLLELMVVISIIGFCASNAIMAINNARVGARDAIRIADIQTIQKALELYYDDHQTYPDTVIYGEGDNIGVCNNGWDCSYEDADGDGKYFLDILEEEGYLPKVPLGPKNNNASHYRYAYFRNSGMHWGCMGPYYVLMATQLGRPIGINDNVCYEFWKSDYHYVIVGGQN